MGTFFRILDSLIPNLDFKVNLKISEKWITEAINVIRDPESTEEEKENAKIDLKYLK